MKGSEKFLGPDEGGMFLVHDAAFLIIPIAAMAWLGCELRGSQRVVLLTPRFRLLGWCLTSYIGP